MEEKRTIKICDQTVVLDSAKLYFSEGTIGEYLEQEGAWIDYFGAKLAEAERELAELDMEIEREDDEYERILGKIFAMIKENEGGSDKLTEGKVKSEPMVVAARQKVLELKVKAVEKKYHVRLLQQHLKAWQLNHENCQNRGNTLRKELERLHKDKFTYEDKMDEIIKAV